MVLTLKQGALAFGRLMKLLRSAEAKSEQVRETDEAEVSEAYAGLDISAHHEGPCLLINERGALESAEVAALVDVSCVNPVDRVWTSLPKGPKQKRSRAFKSKVRWDKTNQFRELNDAYGQLLQDAKGYADERSEAKDTTFEVEDVGDRNPFSRKLGDTMVVQVRRKAAEDKPKGGKKGKGFDVLYETDGPREDFEGLRAKGLALLPIQGPRPKGGGEALRPRAFNLCPAPGISLEHFHELVRRYLHSVQQQLSVTDALTTKVREAEALAERSFDVNVELCGRAERARLIQKGCVPVANMVQLANLLNEPSARRAATTCPGFSSCALVSLLTAAPLRPGATKARTPGLRCCWWESRSAARRPRSSSSRTIWLRTRWKRTAQPPPRCRRCLSSSPRRRSQPSLRRGRRRPPCLLCCMRSRSSSRQSIR